MDRILYQPYVEPILVPTGPTPVPHIVTWSPSISYVDARRRLTQIFGREERREAFTPVDIIPFAGNELLAPYMLNETWADHFESRGWSTVQDQINAGYPYYIQPVPQSGKYVEVIDYGAVFNNVIVNVDWSTRTIAGTVTITSQVEHSIDGVVWSPPILGTSMFILSFRFLRATVFFQGAN